MELAAAIIIDFRESIDGPAPHRCVDSPPRAKGQAEVEGGADQGRRVAGKAPARPCGSCSSNPVPSPFVSGPAMNLCRHTLEDGKGWQGDTDTK